MFSYVKDKAMGAAASAVIEVLRRRGHTFTGTVSISADSFVELLDGAPASVREPLRRLPRGWPGRGLRVRRAAPRSARLSGHMN